MKNAKSEKVTARKDRREASVKSVAVEKAIAKAVKGGERRWLLCKQSGMPCRRVSVRVALSVCRRGATPRGGEVEARECGGPAA